MQNSLPWPGSDWSQPDIPLLRGQHNLRVLGTSPAVLTTSKAFWAVLGSLSFGDSAYTSRARAILAPPLPLFYSGFSLHGLCLPLTTTRGQGKVTFSHPQAQFRQDSKRVLRFRTGSHIPFGRIFLKTQWKQLSEGLAVFFHHFFILYSGFQSGWVILQSQH